MAGGLVERVLLASPRGYCAGVERAVETVELALERCEAPVYVRKQIVHNGHVVRELEERGAIFVDDESEVPAGSTVVFSAHGVAPAVHAAAAARGLATIDATCPLVTKVHVQARRYAASGYTIVLIGHAGHEEVVGTMGEAPEAISLVESVEDAEALELPEGQDVAYVTQTTLSVDETAIDEAWLAERTTVGLTSGASAPERLVAQVCDWFRARGVRRFEEFRNVREDVFFKLPVELRRPAATNAA